MIPYPRESCLNMETPVGGEWGKICIFSIINKHHATPRHTTLHRTPHQAKPRGHILLERRQEEDQEEEEEEEGGKHLNHINEQERG